MEIFWFVIPTIILLLYLYYKKSYQYWEKKGIVTIKPKIPFGNLGNPFDGKGIEKMVRMYETFKSMRVQYGGFYAGTTPMLLLAHPDAVKTVVNKQFQSFNSHGSNIDEKEEPLLAHLFNLEGKRWRDMRVKLTPTFTSGKMKMMFQTMLDCGEQLERFVFECTENGKPLDIKDTVACYTTDVIGSCAFGLDCNSFTNPNAEFRTYGKKVLTPNIKFTLRRLFNLPPSIVKLLQLHIVEPDVTDFFMGVVNDMINCRRTENITRNDFMQILINMQDSAKAEGKAPMTTEEIAAQAFVFFAAGFETSSTTASFCLYELARHQNIQDKLREEIRTKIKENNGKITYDGITEMKYLEQVINETLRKYPPVHTLPRRCTQNCTLPNGVLVEKGTKVLISVLGMHKDKEYFPNPEKFDPERFSDENKHNIVPYSYLPFGEGPRICIGLRFGVMQTKVALCLLLKNFKVFPHSSTKYHMQFAGNTAVLSGKDPIILRTEKVN
ncbi:cytochrome P450 6a2-like [Onthophagus taurus]|uniref:cytochrome P450 6a2-like n=1 Tax=Onthophagus taurus TaxID=166361 RepID=UPI0039BE1BF7